MWRRLAAVALLLLPMATPAVQQNTPPGQQQGGAQGGRNAGVRPKRPQERRAGESRATSSTTSKDNAAAPSAQAESLTTTPSAQSYAPVLAAADFSLLGLSVTAGPATQTVPKNTPTSVLTSVDVPPGGDAAAAAAALNPNYRVRGELTGPSLNTTVVVEARVGEPLRLPALTSAGDHALHNLRVVDVGTPGQDVVAPVTPDSCAIVVIDRLLVSEVHVNELTYEQIVQSGINLSDDSYSYFNFTLGVGTTSSPQRIDIPVAFPGVGVPDPRPVVGLPSTPSVGVDVPVPVPDVLPIMLTVDGGRDDLEMPDGAPLRIPGVVVFPGRIGLLHQFFEATVIVANGAPGGTPLVVRNLKARIKLPDAGTPASAADDPLRVAETQAGGRTTELELHGLGGDNRYGTPDDVNRFAPGESGQASFLVEGLKEGLHTINFDLEGTLDGLPAGPVTVRGEVPGAVLVRDASFSVTFTHPSVVRAGQEYELALTLYNSGQRDIQSAVADLARTGISGAELIGQEIRRQFTPVRRGDSATVKWRLRASVTGAVTASYAKVGEGIESGLSLVTGVGDRGVPLSPDSLILPDTVRHLPPDVVEAARGLLGQAWSVANAPYGSLPEGIVAVDKRTVVARAVELGVAGLRANFGESAEVTLLTLARDWLGELQQTPDPGFADAARDTAAGFRWYDAVGSVLHKRMSTGAGAREILTELSNAESPRSAFISALVTQAPGEPAFGAKLVGGGAEVGFGATPEERAGGLRSGAALRLDGAQQAGGAVTSFGQMLLVSKPAAGDWTLEVTGWRDGAADIELLVPTGDGAYRQLVLGGVQVKQGSRHRVRFRPSGTAAPTLEEFRDGAFQTTGASATVAAVLSEPAPRVVGVVQVTPEVIGGGDKYGRLVGVLFSKPMLKSTAEAAANYAVGGGALKGSNPPEQVGGAVGVRSSRLDYGDRFAFLALDTPVGPYIERDLSVNGVTDRRGAATANPGAKTTISMRVSPEGKPPGAYLTGRVVGADGTPVPGAKVLYWTQECDQGELPKDPTPIAQRVTDAQGRYVFDYVRDGDCGPVVVTVQNPVTLSEKRLTTPVAYDGQHMTLDMVFLARGKVRGTVTRGGQPLPAAVVQVVPSLDAVGTKVVQTDASGNYLAEDIPVGNVSVLVVGSGQAATSSGIGAGTIEGPNATAVVNVSLQNTSGVVRGRVVNPDAAQTPASGALVIAYAAIPGFDNQERSDKASPVGYAFSGRDGGFRLDNLPVGSIKLEVTDYVTRAVTSQQLQLTDAAPELSGVLVVLPGYGTVKGKVVDESGSFMPLAVVTGAGRGVQADALGDYTLPNMPAGTHEITAIDPQTLMTGTARVQVHFGQTTSGVNIPILRAATVSGRVMINENGATVPAAKVYVSTDGYHKFPTDEQGRYTVRNVQPNAELKLRFVDPVRNLVINQQVYLSPGEQLTRDVTFRPGQIHGRVTQPDGVNGVVAPIQIYSPVPVMREGRDWGLADSSRPLATQTGADGAYRMSGVNPGAYRVVASSSFFPTPVSAGGTLAPGADDEVNLSLVSTLAGKIQGKVFRPDGETSAGAGVRVTLGGGSLADVTVQTNAEGRYEFAEVFAEGSYFLTAADPVSGQTERVRVSVQRNKDLVADLRLRGMGALRVTVLDGAGNPVPSGTITLDGSEFPNAHRFAELSADAGGVFQFDNLPEGRYAISATRNGLGGRAAASVAVGSAVEVSVQLQATGTVKGRVLMPDGSTVIGMADVELKVGGRSLGFTVSSDADEDRGSFTFPNVPAGQFTLDVLDNRTGRAGRATGQLSAQGETVSLDVKLLPVGAVSGQVTANGQPVDHALVEIYANGSGIRREHLKATTDEQGRFRFTGIPAGAFQISVTGAPGGQTGSASGFVTGATEPLPDTVVNITLEPSVTVAGKVYRHGGAQPVNGARVRLSVGTRRFEATTDDTGSYRIGYVPLGEIVVRAESPAGFDRGDSSPVVAAEPGATVTADVSMRGVGTVGGTALDSTGLPLSNGAVTFTNDAWRDAPLTVIAAVEPNGRYEIKGVPAGPFSLRLTVPNRIGVGSASAELAADQTLDLPIRLEDAGQVVGRLKSVDGVSPSVGADVTLNLVTAGGKSLRFYAHTDATGAWRVANVPLGSLTVTAFDNLTGGVARYGAAQLATNNQTLDLGELSLDNTPARVESVTPQNGATGVSPAAPGITVLFSEPVDPTTINSGSVRLLRGTSDVSASVALSSDGRTLTLTPAGQLADTTLYTVVVMASISDRAGNRLASETRSSFTTSDVTPPTVQSVSPANGATGVPLDSAVVVTFNEALGAAQPLDAIVRLSPGSAAAQPVAGSATLDESGRVLTFKPAAALEDGTLHAVRVSGQRDPSGNAQSDTFASSFTSFVPPNQGTVRVEVRGTAGVAVQGAQLTLNTSEGALTGLSGLDGSYRFKPVALGDVTVQATDPATGLRGKATGKLATAGQTLTLTVNLAATGVVTGVVFRPGGATPAEGVQVEVRSDSAGIVDVVTTGADGRYAVDFVPVGGFTVEAREAASGDRGRVSNQLNVKGETRTINVTLNGVGRVRVTVRDAADKLVSGAQVQLSSQSQFGGTQTAASAADGTAVFERVFAGNFNVNANDPATGLGGSQSGSVAHGATADVVVKLRPAGAVTGTVFAANGTTPAAGVTVRLLLDGWSVERQGQTAADGTFRFETVPTGTYVAEALDASGRRRARAEGVTLSQNGQTVTRDLTLVGAGVVRGRVLRPNNTPVAGQFVSVRSPVAYFGGSFGATTDAQGNYSVAGVPVGGFTASADRSGEQLLGEASGQISRDGEEVTADIRLVSNAVNLPVTRRDGNNHIFHVQPDGSVMSDSPIYGYNWESPRGSSILSLVVNGSESRFAGSGVGSATLGGRELTIRQTGLAGLDVTRRVYVPTYGYFARYLEVLRNPTASPVTVDVRVLHNHGLAWYGGQNVFETSSGDKTINVSGSTPDRWVTLDDSQDGESGWNMPPVSYVFDGAGAPERVAAAGYGGSTGLQLSYEWRQVTIQPGQTVAYVHFGVQQVERVGARASAERLVQLPPEALVGLSAEDAAAVRNFSVPADGVGAVAPLPALDGRITARAIASDGVTPVPGASITLKSKNPLYGRTYPGQADQNGSLTFATYKDGDWYTAAVPVDAFTLTATHNVTRAVATAEGAFAAGTSQTTKDVVFTGTSIIRGTVRRHTGAPVSQGYVYINGPGVSSQVSIKGDGTYEVTGLVTNSSYNLYATIPDSWGVWVRSPALNVTPSAGQILNGDLTIVPTGTVAGTVRTATGALAAGVHVQARTEDGSFYRSRHTNASGAYVLPDVPAGNYTLLAYEPASGVPTTAGITVTASQTLTHDLTLVALGSVQVQVTHQNGGPAAGSLVQLQIPARSTWFDHVGYTDSAGRLNINNVAAGAFVVRAWHPSTGDIYEDKAGTLTTSGQVVPVAVALPGLGVLSGTVRYPDGRIVPSAPVYLMEGQSSFRGVGTNSSGVYSMTQVPTGRDLRLRVYDPLGGFKDSETFRLSADGESRTLDVTLGARANVQVTVLKADNTPNPGARVEIRHATSGGNFYSIGNTDASGRVTVSNVPEGAFTVRAFTSSGLSAGSADGAVTQANSGQTLSVTITAPKAVTFEGTVVAADGQTPVEGAGVLVFDRVTNQLVTFDSRGRTDAQGFYRVANVPVSVNGYKVAVVAPSSYTSADQFIDAGDPRTLITYNYTLPVGVIRGKVTLHDGQTPVADAYVEARYRAPTGNIHYWTTESNAAGEFLLIGEAQGVVELTATEQTSYLSATANVEMTDVATPKSVTLLLPPTGAVSGVVRDAAGAAVANAMVNISDASDPYGFTIRTDAQGAYRSDYVRLGAFHVHAVHPSFQLAGIGAGVLSAPGDSAVVDITLAASGTVSGTVYDASGQPVADANVSLRNYEQNGALGAPGLSTYTDSAGNYALSNVPVGSLLIAARDPVNSRNSGLVEGTLAGAGASTVVDITLGNAFNVNWYDYELDGADGFRYDVDWRGGLSDGGRVDGSLSDAFDGSDYLTLDGLWFGPFSAALLEDSGRELVFGPWKLRGVKVVRKVFSPLGGGFARHLEILTNTTGQDITVAVENLVDLGSDGRTRVVFSPADNGGHYAVTDQGGNCCDPTVASVFGGPGAALKATTQYADGNDSPIHRWNVTIPAGQTFVLMRFTVQRGLTDSAGAKAQAEALVSLSDPHALDGMTAEEKARVVNFVIPPSQLAAAKPASGASAKPASVPAAQHASAVARAAGPGLVAPPTAAVPRLALPALRLRGNK